jgi:hypothetical protein
MGGGPQYNFYYKAYCANAASPCTSYLVHMKVGCPALFANR